MTIDLGADFETPGGELQPDMRLLDSDNGKALCFLYACRTRLQMPRGSLWFDRNAGLDMREFVNDVETPANAMLAINGELLKDERCARCDTQITVNANGSWNVVTNPQSKDGTVFQLVFLVNATNSALLSASVVS
jgi:hypothetical protein